MEYVQLRKIKAAETERTILNTALKLMRERGFDRVSVRDICKESGITTGAFYHHFSSKEDLLSGGFAPMDECIETALKGQECEPPDKRLWLILEAYARFMDESGELAGRYYQRRMAAPEGGGQDSDRFALRAMLDCFCQAESMGVLAPGQSPRWVAEFCYRHFRGVVVDWILHGYAYPLLPKMKEDYALFERLFRV